MHVLKGKFTRNKLLPKKKLLYWDGNPKTTLPMFFLTWMLVIKIWITNKWTQPQISLWYCALLAFSFLIKVVSHWPRLSIRFFWGVKITPTNLNLVLCGRSSPCVAVSDLANWTRWIVLHNFRKLKYVSFQELWRIIPSCSINLVTNETIRKCAHFCAIACEHIIAKTKCRQT